MIIGLCGPAGAGKNTVSDFLAEDYGFKSVSFAEPIYRAVSEITGLSVEQLQDRQTKEEPIEWLGVSPRVLLQTLGTDWGRNTIKHDMWIRLAMSKVDGDTVITDVRFDDEAEAIKAAGGEVWHVSRPCGNCCKGDAASHPSEQGVSQSLIDVSLANDGTIADIRAKVFEELCQHVC